MIAEDQSITSQVLCGLGAHSTVDQRRINFAERISKLVEPSAPNLHISPEIRDYILREEYFKYALYTIIEIIKNKLSEINKPYNVYVTLEVDHFNPNDKHSDITVKIRDTDHINILNIWDDIGHNIGCFLKSLSDGAIMPVSVANRLYGFINLIFAPDN